MIHRIVEFALKQRPRYPGCRRARPGWARHQRVMNLPIEAYPDVADTLVQIISAVAGHAGEEVERQITVPTERG